MMLAGCQRRLVAAATAPWRCSGATPVLPVRALALWSSSSLAGSGARCGDAPPAVCCVDGAVRRFGTTVIKAADVTAKTAEIKEVMARIRECAAAPGTAASPTAKELIDAIEAAKGIRQSPMPLVNLIAANAPLLSISTQLASLCLDTAVLCRDASGAVAVAEAIAAKSVVPTLPSVESALQFVGASGHHAATVKLFEMLVKNGLDVPRSAVIVAVHSYACVGKGDAAMRLLLQLTSPPTTGGAPADANADLPVDFMDNIIATLCTSQCSEQAMAVFLRARDMNRLVSGDTIVALVKAHLRNVEGLLHVFSHAVKTDKLFNFYMREKMIDAMVSLPDTVVLEPLLEVLQDHAGSTRPGVR